MVDLQRQRVNSWPQSLDGKNENELEPHADDFNTSAVENMNEGAPTENVPSNYIRGARLHAISVV